MEYHKRAKKPFMLEWQRTALALDGIFEKMTT
jgi:hypothetical protein